MSNNEKYWLVIDSWNLIESFTTESISPYSFYENRGFGNTLTRYVPKGGGTINHLILTSFEPASDYAIEISIELLETSLLKNYKNKKTIFTYPKTIYYKKGNIRFRFSSEDIMIGFIAESKILFEVKCVEKYSNSFYFNNKAIKIIKTNISSNILFERNNYLEHDKQYNFIKGSIIAYVRGQLTSMNSGQQNLLICITDLKNTFTGLNTTIMIGDDSINDLNCLQKISICKQEYDKQNLEATSLFDILKQVFQEVVKLTSMRSNVLKIQKSPQYLYEFDNLLNKKYRFQKKLSKIESEYFIGKIRFELDSIKHAEADKGKKNGKSRLYFPKNSPEYMRKQELKEIIKEFEEENNEYKELKKELIEIEERIAKYRIGSTEYDSTLGSLFARLSDGVNDLLKKINKHENHNSINLTNLEIVNNELRLIPNGFNIEEVAYLNIVLNYILANPLQGTRVISEVDIMNIIVETCKIYKQIFQSESEISTKMLEVLRQYWSYKNNKADTFEIPDDLPVLQAIMSFYIKAQGFDQIERFMLNRKYQHKEFAFILWGAFIGFAAIPKTFTKIIFENDRPSINDYIDNYLFDNILYFKDKSNIQNKTYFK
jgi:hypothetical protein